MISRFEEKPKFCASKLYWFVLEEDSGLISFYQNKEDEGNPETVAGIIRIADVVLVNIESSVKKADREKKSSIILVTTNGHYSLTGQSESDTRFACK